MKHVHSPLLSVLLTLSLVASLVPTPALAEVTQTTQPQEPVAEQTVEAPAGEGAGEGSTENGSQEGQTEAPAGQGSEGAPEAQPEEAPADETSDEQDAETELEAQEEAQLSVVYRAHVQNDGWQNEVSDGAEAGTTARGLRVEALNISLRDAETGAAIPGISYRAHVQNIGWQDWRSDGTEAGTTGGGLRVEALQIKLSDELAAKYDIYYRVHVQNIGWMGWASNGQRAGTAGQSLRIEAVQIRLVPKGEAAPDPAGQATGDAFRGALGVSYTTHVQNIGWQGACKDGATAGTTGRGLRVEALTVSLCGDDLTQGTVSGGVEYQAHVQNIGWQGWASNGGVAGTSGQSLRVEAIRMRLTGAIANDYSIYYRVHVQNIGWMTWAKDGEAAGSEGMGQRVEAVQIRLVPKTAAAPDNAGASIGQAFAKPSAVSYQTSVQNDGWQAQVSGGASAGTTGQGKAVELVRAALTPASEGRLAGGIQYRSHVSNAGWQGWVADGAESGVAGARTEAIQMQLTGQMAQYCSVWYRVHVQNVGWLGWAHDGETAGSEGQGLRVEAVQVVVRAKAQGAPGSTADHQWYGQTPLERSMGGYGSPTNWIVYVNRGERHVYVFQGMQGLWKLDRDFVCTVGAPWSPTISGIFNVGIKEYVFGHGYSCYYATQISGDYLFHSVIYYPGTFTVKDGQLGTAASHGCVRLAIENAKWIYDNIPSGTTVVIV